MAAATRHARVVVTRHPLWRLRLARELLRYLLWGASLAGLAASARFAIDPPRPIVRAASKPVGVDLAAEAFASLFVRDYLTWKASDPEIHESALQPFVGADMEADAGLELPTRGDQSVEWTQVVQERTPLPGEHVYTVAAQTSTSGLVYMSVSVERRPGGALALSSYPAFVGAPATSAAVIAGGALAPVGQVALWIVVRRALGNYLAGSAGELEADLAPGARVTLPGLDLSLLSLASLQWTARDEAVLAQVTARDGRGAQYRLAYELEVLWRAGRWEIAAIETDPDQ